MVASLIAKSAISTARSSVSMQTARAFSTSLTVKKDFVQEIYLRELKAYKAPAKASDAHVGQVRDFHAPKQPQAPAVPSSSDLSGELDAYAKAEPDHAEKAASSSAGGDVTENTEGVREFLEAAKAPYKVEEAHH